MKALFGSRFELARVRREGFARGIRAVAPLLIGTGIGGLVTGVAMVKVGLSTAQAIGMTLLVFSERAARFAPSDRSQPSALGRDVDGGGRQPPVRDLFGRATPVFSTLFIGPPMAAHYFMVDMSFAIFCRGSLTHRETNAERPSKSGFFSA